MSADEQHTPPRPDTPGWSPSGNTQPQRLLTWEEVTPVAPCLICGKPDWCTRSRDEVWAICRRLDTGTGTHKVDSAGMEYWVYKVGARPHTEEPRVALPVEEVPPCATPETRDAVYRGLLATLTLTLDHLHSISAARLERS